MRRVRLLATLTAATVLAGATAAVAWSSADAVSIPPATTSAAAAPVTSWPAVPVSERLQPWLARELGAGGARSIRVMVSGETFAAARRAAESAGLRVQQRWTQIGTVVAVGTPEQVRGVVALPGVRHVAGEQPIAWTLNSAHRATRSDEALAQLSAADGSRLDGRGVTIAVIDSGIDGTHPFFTRAGVSKVVRNLENVCTVVTGASDTCFQPEPTHDTDTNSGGGHGTHVAGIAAGYEVTTTAPAGVRLRGAAPEAKLVGLSVGAGLNIINAVSAMNWVIDHQRKPCAAATAQGGELDPSCPPIRVTNHSYGPIAGPNDDNTFSENSAAVTAQRVLVSKGVSVVWAAGNDGGDGSMAKTNPPAMDPTPGVLMVASYNDAQTGARDSALSSFSSRGKKGSPGTYPDIAAPGDRITSSCRGTLAVCTGSPSYDAGNYQTISGTSMSTPYIAGVVAQLAQADGRRTPGQVEQLLEDTAHRFSAGGAYEADPRNSASLTSFDKGHGLVDVFAALTAAVTAAQPGSTAPPEPSVPAAQSTSGPSPTASQSSTGPAPESSGPSASPSATPSGEVSPAGTGSPTASSPASPPSPPSPSSSPPASAAQATCPAPVRLRVNTPVINASGLASVTVLGARPGQLVDLQGYSQDHFMTRSFANDATPRDRSALADAQGAVTINDLRLASNTRLRASERGCAASESAVVSVRTLLTLAVEQSAPRSYRISGQALPAREGGLIVSLYRVTGSPCAAGVPPHQCPGEQLLSQARADGASGRYAFAVRFPTSLTGERINLVLKTGADGQNAPGRSNTRNLLITG